MSELLERIKKAYILETDAEVAEFLDLNPSTLSMQKNRGRFNLKRIIEKCTDLNKNWLLEGEGPMWKDELSSGAKEIPIFSSIKLQERNNLDFQNSLTDGNILIDIPEELDDFAAPSDNLIGYTIREDAMAPELKEQDIAFFDLRSSAPKNNTIFLVSYDRKIVCRRIKESEESYILSCENGYQDDVKISKSDKEFTILGEMMWVLRSI